MRVAADGYVRNGDGSTESGEATVSWNGAFKSGAGVTTGVTTAYEDLRDGFALTDEVDVESGSYTFTSAYVDYETAPGSLVGDASVSGGTFFDGWRLTAGAWPSWKVSKHLELSGGYEINRIVFADRDQAFTAHVGQVRVRAALNTKLSASAFLQVNSTAEAGLANVRLRYNPREGSDFYLVWNEGFNTNRLRESPARPFTSGRALLAKYTYTFAL